LEATWWTKPEHLDDTQRGVLALDKDQSHLVCGPPGSGKTNLLLLRAAYLHKLNRRNFIVLTYGRVLREFLVTGAEHYPFSADRLKTYFSWAASLSQEHGLAVPTHGSERKKRQALSENLLAIVDEGDFSPFDCLLVDEAQDYSPSELSTMVALSRQVFMVGDERQEIYGTHNGLPHAKSLISSQMYLSAHYRNGLQICRVADAIFDELDEATGLEATSQYDEMAFPSTAIAVGGQDITAQVARVVDDVANQLIAYPTGFIGVLCPRNEDLEVVSGLLAASVIGEHVQVETFSQGYRPLSADRRVLVTTMHGAKGLEFRAVHLVAAEQVRCFRAQQKRVAYTSITRAKTYLAVYHDGALPGFLDKAMTCADITPVAEPGLDELFL
jgi:superfamily I DNA/RNA helicase